MVVGRSATLLKNEYLERFGIPARMFNAVRVSLEGKVASVKEQQKLRVEQLGAGGLPGRRVRWQTLSGAGGGIRFTGRVAGWRQSASGRRTGLQEADMAAGRVRLCFGSRKLWRKQHNLAENGYASHEEWLSHWREARSDEFFVLGSRDETAGCQLCVATHCG